MADNDNQSMMDSMREEFKSLRAQVEDLLKTANEKRHDLTDDMAEKIARELEKTRKKAGERAEQLRHAGQHGLGEVEAQVRQNPLVSLLIAFGLGWVVSCIIRHLR